MTESIVEVNNLVHCYNTSTGIIRAVDDISFRISNGEIFSIVGESGSGKSTVAKCIMNICKPQSGEIKYKGINICKKNEYKRNKKQLQAERQIVFQDSASCINYRMRICDIITEPLKINGIKPKRGSLRAEAEFQLHYVGMDKSYLDKYPSELSGGQRQRVAIARALSIEPSLLVADEPVSALDASVQAQIINLFRHLKKEHGFSILFISHDLSVVEYISDRVCVMYNGRIVEIARTEDLFKNPIHWYTRALMNAMPCIDPVAERSRQSCFDYKPCELGAGMREIEPEHYVLI